MTLKITLDELVALPQSRLEISFHETLEGTDAVKPVVGELVVSATSTGMKLCGRVQTLLKLNCHRCLRPYFQSTCVDIDERFIKEELSSESEKSIQRDRELLARDFVESLPAGNALDITDIVYQAVTLATPTTCSCGAECPGPPTPTKSSKKPSLNSGKEGQKRQNQIDPRWENLKSLFANEDTESKS